VIFTADSMILFTTCSFLSFNMHHLLFSNIRRSFRPACASHLRFAQPHYRVGGYDHPPWILITVGATVPLPHVTLRPGWRILITWSHSWAKERVCYLGRLL